MECLAGSHQYSVFGSLAGTAHDRKRRRNADRTRIAHHENTQAGKDCALDIGMPAGKP